MISRKRIEEEAEEEEKDAEVTLTTASLLGIFFALVLICAVFFGFGYSLGRGGSSPALVSAANNANHAEHAPSAPSSLNHEEPATMPPVSTPPSIDADSSGQEQPQQPVTLRASDPGREVTPETSPDEDLSQERTNSVEPRTAAPGTLSNPSHTPAQMGLTASTKVNARGASEGTMVQIAAVARREDADALVSALRQRGFQVVVRDDPADKLLHVQVGPFPSRREAYLMKQKLLSTGYNAIVKQ